MAIKKRMISPRQKMINLMYVVLMAMLAMNVSSEVLEGFSIVEKSLARTTEQTTKENMSLYDAFDKQYSSNAAKTKEWYMKAETVKDKSQYLFDLISEIKRLIAIEADGPKADVNNIKNKESLEAAAQVMIAPGKVWGDKLYNSINSYREDMLKMVEDPYKKAVISANLSTEVPQNKENKNWKEYYFEEMPAVAVLTFLTKLQSDIRYTEGEVLHTLMTNIDAGDVRVNSLEALVIPNSQTIVRGNKFTANIVMAAIDTTQVPEIYVGEDNTRLSGNIFEAVCTRTGDFNLKGYLQTAGKDGSLIRRSFSQPYSVVEPTATVSSDLMNVLYAGYNNPISVSVPGVPLSQVTATMDGGSLTKTAEGRYIARPSRMGKATISVFSNASGKQQQMAQYEFRVRRLPEPTTYITIKDEKGNSERYFGGAINRTALTSAGGIGAAIDDGILDVPFRVKSFETVFFDRMGNAVPMASEGNSFTERQKEAFQKLARNRRFYISRVTAIGPDGIERKLKTSMELIMK